MITGYVVLTLILHNGASSFGIDERIAMLIELAEGYTASATTLKKEVEAGDREHLTFITDKNLIRNWSMKLMPKWWPKHQLLLQQSTEWVVC